MLVARSAASRVLSRSLDFAWTFAGDVGGLVVVLESSAVVHRQRREAVGAFLEARLAHLRDWDRVRRKSLAVAVKAHRESSMSQLRQVVAALE